MNLSVSISGGRTSGYMAYMLKNHWRHMFDEMVFTFANTGFEHEKTLEFLNKIDKQFGLGIVWLEADVNPQKGIGNRAKVVTFETADRSLYNLDQNHCGPFESYVKKHGIPNMDFPKCSSELKAVVMRAYLRDEIGWCRKKDYQVAIGIRAYEPHRLPNREVESKENLIYPLYEIQKTTKNMVLSWWKRQDFDLEIPEYLGNCVTCWKKSDRKLFTVADENPVYFHGFQKFESLYAFRGPGYHNNGSGRRFFRKQRTVSEIIDSSKQPFYRHTDAPITMELYEEEMDFSPCGESCEVY